MKLWIPFFAASFAIGAGCSPLHEVRLEEADVWLPGARSRLLEREAIVTTRTGKSVKGIIEGLDTSGITVRSSELDTTWHLPLGQVESIQKPKKVWGLLGGIVGGALAGGVMAHAIAVGGLVGGSTLGLATSADLYQISRKHSK